MTPDPYYNNNNNNIFSSSAAFDDDDHTNGFSSLGVGVVGNKGGFSQWINSNLNTAEEDKMNVEVNESSFRY